MQLHNAKNYIYEIVSVLDKYSREKKINFISIDLAFEGLGLNEIDGNGEYIKPTWLKSEEEVLILIYGIDELSRRNYKIKQLTSLFEEGKVNNFVIPSTKHFIIISDKLSISEAFVYPIDIKKQLPNNSK